MLSSRHEQFELANNSCACYELLYKLAMENGEIFTDINFLKQLQKVFETTTFDKRI